MMEKVTKNDLIDSIYKKNQYERQTVQDVMDSLLEELKNCLAEGKVVELRRFGTLEPLLRNGRKEARNPKTGEKCSVPPHYTARFRPGKELKESLMNLPVENEK